MERTSVLMKEYFFYLKHHGKYEKVVNICHLRTIHIDLLQFLSYIFLMK